MSQSNNNPPAAPARTVVQHLDGFRRLLISLDTSGRQALNAFWRDVRQSLNDQDQIIQDLTQRMAARHILSPPTPARPGTSHSVNVIRDTVEQALCNDAQMASDASATIEAICELDPTWALLFVRRQVNVQRTDNHPLGCWVSGNVAAHDNGYVKMNLRGTRIPGEPPGVVFSVQPYGHQMGVVAGGHGPELRLTTKGEYHVSHLCHNTACFNPEHLLIEPQALNKQRNSCANSFVIRCYDGTVIHPCTHWRGDRQLQCILPMVRLTIGMAGQWVDMSPTGPVIRTGRSNQ